ncbi:hypothetical protein C8Q73DRAFT_288531 [Cubamyces lactineus]|nr:hypothetical protein C8Q73DRAFT_288531 [Cubamyces lactineus]
MPKEQVCLWCDLTYKSAPTMHNRSCKRYLFDVFLTIPAERKGEGPKAAVERDHTGRLICLCYDPQTKLRCQKRAPAPAALQKHLKDGFKNWLPFSHPDGGLEATQDSSLPADMENENEDMGTLSGV